MNHELVEKLDKMVEKELAKMVEKNDLTSNDVENVTKAVCLLHKLRHETEDEMMMDNEEGMYSQMRYYPMSFNFSRNGNSYERGRSSTTGRYMSRNNGYSSNGYSQSGNDELISQLEMMRNRAGNEQERRMIDQWINSAMNM